MKTCWIVQDYHKPAHVLESEEDARAYAAMTGTEDLYEALYIEEDPMRKAERAAAAMADGCGLSLADMVEILKADKSELAALAMGGPCE